MLIFKLQNGDQVSVHKSLILSVFSVGVWELQYIHVTNLTPKSPVNIYEVWQKRSSPLHPLHTLLSHRNENLRHRCSICS